MTTGTYSDQPALPQAMLFHGLFEQNQSRCEQVLMWKLSLKAQAFLVEQVFHSANKQKKCKRSRQKGFTTPLWYHTATQCSS